MNIKKVFIVVLCFALSFCISISVFAEVNLDDFAYYADDGSLQYDMDAYYFAYAQDLVLHSGVDIDPSNYWIVSSFTGETVGYNYDLFKSDYDSVISSLTPEPVESSSVSEPTVEDVSVDNISIEDYADDDLNYDTPIEIEDNSVSNLLETTENNAELEYREDTPMVYRVNDMRSSSLSPLSYSLNTSDSDLTFENIWGSNSGFSSKSPDYSYYIRYTDGSWFNMFDPITPEIDLINKYIYFPEINKYLDTHWKLHDSIPLYSAGDNFDSIWGEYYFTIKNDIFDSEHDIRQVAIYPDCTYNYFKYDASVNALEQNEPITVNMDKRYIYLPAISVYITDNWQVSYTEPMFNTSDSEVELTGTLKDLIISIFGKYTPILTPATVTETVDNVTTTTIIDAVASGMAGVDWEWCAGVFLFGIMLFCLFKLLGGILS